MNNEFFNNIDDRLDAAVEADEVGTFMSDFMVQTLSTVLLDGAVKVTDLAGEIASRSNNYLLNEEGNKFSGLVTTAAGETVEFHIIERANGNWAVSLPCRTVA